MTEPTAMPLMPNARSEAVVDADAGDAHIAPRVAQSAIIAAAWPWQSSPGPEPQSRASHMTLTVRAGGTCPHLEAGGGANDTGVGSEGDGCSCGGGGEGP